MQLTSNKPTSVNDLKPSGKDIILGIFTTGTFRKLDDIGFLTYRDFEEWSIAQTVLAIVRDACYIADRIIFVLDYVRFPIDAKSSITCAELQLVCENDKFFEKTIFVKGENIINFDRNLIIN